MAQLVAAGAGVDRGPHTILDAVDLTLADGDRLGVVGANGSGKTTLLRVLAGELDPDRGRVTRIPADLGVGLFRQQLDDAPDETAAEVLARRSGVAALDAELTAAADALAQDAPDADRYDRALSRFTAADVAGFDERRDRVLDQVGLDPDVLDRPAGTLSGGQRSRLGLAALLLGTHDVVLLDEPTNDLDADGIALLERLCLTERRPLAVVSHDRAFLEAVVDGVLEIDEHSRTAHRFDGGFSAWQTERATRRRHAETDHATYVARRDELRRRAQQEREWATKGVRKAAKGENDKNVRFREMQRSEQMAGKARRTDRALERLEVIDKPFEGWELRLRFAEAARAGTEVAVLAGATVTRGSFTLGPVDLTVTSGERVAVVGANGSGKTTLLSALLGDIALEGGLQHRGPSVVVGRLDQPRRRFSEATRVLDAFVDETDLTIAEARSQLAKLGLDSAHVDRPAASLSPGERTRAVLAAFAATGVNCLVLDEPTNHLDLPAIEQLERALEAFTGTVLLVSHDRRLLEGVRLTRRIEVTDGQIASDRPTA